jgi:hypothetical protein
MKLTSKEVIESGTIQQQKELKKLYEIKIKMIDEKISQSEPSKKVEFTERELNFSKDDAQPLCNKYFNKKYNIHKEVILTFITKKFENAKTRKGKIDKICLVFEKFFEELEKEKSHLHIKEQSKAA